MALAFSLLSGESGADALTTAAADSARLREHEGEAASETPSQTSAVKGGVVDVNSASIEDLCTLPGIGPKKAEAIIALRERRPLTRLTQLLLVRGIGKKTLEKLRPQVVFRPVERVPQKTPMGQEKGQADASLERSKRRRVAETLGPEKTAAGCGRQSGGAQAIEGATADRGEPG